MKAIRSYKTELDPNNFQRTMLMKTAGAARFAYNWGLARRKEEYAKTGKSSNAIEQHKQLNALKPTEFPWLYEVSKCAPQEALRDLDGSYENFYRSIKAGEKPAFPRFKSKWKTKPSFRISARIGISDRAIRVPNIGWVRLKEHGYIPRTGTPGVKQLSATFSCTAGRWFVSVQFETEESEVVVAPTRTVGLDPGVKTLLVTSDGDVFENPKFLKKAQRKLRRQQRKVARRTKGGKNRKKAVKAVAVQHYRVACKRKDAINKVAATLAKTKPDAKFVVEDLNIKGMMKNHHLAGAIGDSGMGMLMRQLACKVGKDRVVHADRWFPSSKMCSRCHAINEGLTLKDRKFVCPVCGFEIDRDLNAAINLRQYEQYVADGVYRPRSRHHELPPVRREVTPVERKGRKQPRGSRNQTPCHCSLASAKG